MESGLPPFGLLSVEKGILTITNLYRAQTEVLRVWEADDNLETKTEKASDFLDKLDTNIAFFEEKIFRLDKLLLNCTSTTAKAKAKAKAPSGRERTDQDDEDSDEERFPSLSSEQCEKAKALRFEFLANLKVTQVVQEQVVLGLTILQSGEDMTDECKSRTPESLEGETKRKAACETDEYCKYEKAMEPAGLKAWTSWALQKIRWAKREKGICISPKDVQNSTQKATSEAKFTFSVLIDHAILEEKAKAGKLTSVERAQLAGSQKLLSQVFQDLKSMERKAIEGATIGELIKKLEQEISKCESDGNCIALNKLKETHGYLMQTQAKLFPKSWLSSLVEKYRKLGWGATGLVILLVLVLSYYGGLAAVAVKTLGSAYSWGSAGVQGAQALVSSISGGISTTASPTLAVGLSWLKTFLCSGVTLTSTVTWILGELYQYSYYFLGTSALLFGSLFTRGSQLVQWAWNKIPGKKLLGKAAAAVGAAAPVAFALDNLLTRTGVKDFCNASTAQLIASTIPDTSSSSSSSSSGAKKSPHFPKPETKSGGRTGTPKPVPQPPEVSPRLRPAPERVQLQPRPSSQPPQRPQPPPLPPQRPQPQSVSPPQATPQTAPRVDYTRPNTDYVQDTPRRPEF